MDKKQRIIQLINYYAGGRTGDFADKLGVGGNTISTWKARNTIDYDLVFAKCENLNAEWLLTGEGEMIKGELPQAVIAEGSNGENDLDLVKSYLNKIYAEQQEIKATISTKLNSVKTIVVSPDQLKQFDDEIEHVWGQIGKKPAAKKTKRSRS
jgi:hypothetical protein